MTVSNGFTWMKKISGLASDRSVYYSRSDNTPNKRGLESTWVT